MEESEITGIFGTPLIFKNVRPTIFGNISSCILLSLNFTEIYFRQMGDILK